LSKRGQRNQLGFAVQLCPRRAGTRSDGRLHRQPAERGGNGVR
jgi:hypothetical protein